MANSFEPDQTPSELLGVWSDSKLFAKAIIISRLKVSGSSDNFNFRANRIDKLNFDVIVIKH